MRSKMSNRPRASLKAKRLTLFACLILVAAALLFFGPAERSLACPSAPVPLRPLFIASQRVVVARAGQSVILQTEKIDPESDYERTLLRTSFYVSESLKSKGAEEQVVHLYSWLWGEDRSVPESYAEGKRLLLFLIEREEGDGFELVDESYGAKDLSDDALKVYVTRIEELARIMSAPKPDKAEIVEWLVRCAEEPATRWEGAYELYASQNFLEQETSEAKGETVEAETAASEYPSEEEASSAEVEETSREEKEEGVEAVTTQVEMEEFSSYSAEMARLITPGQKKRLADVLFNLPEIKDDDWPLFSLVEHWADERMVGFILASLEKEKDDPSHNAEIMVRALAGQFKDEKLAKMAEKYCEYANYSEVETVAAEDDEKKKVDEEEKALTGTPTQKRSIRLKRFMAEAQSVISNQIAMTAGNSQ